MILYYITGIVLIPGIFLAIYAQSKVTSAYSTYSKVHSQSRITAYEMVRAALNRAGLFDIQIQKTSGTLTDHYDHKNKAIRLSNGVFDSSSVAALGVAAHEVGHALQYADNYTPIKLRNSLVPIVNFTSRLMWPLLIIGIIFGLAVPGTMIGNIIIIAGLIFYGSSILISLVTLPTEFNASKRAAALLTTSGILTVEETEQAKKVLNAAAWTYIASLVIALLSMLRFLAIIFLARGRRR
ncbi:MAG TPA: zinc metallopeptidase [Clostridiales bacterium]|nr:zinc metallopeptidase [Clostridiales bacterium]